MTTAQRLMRRKSVTDKVKSIFMVILSLPMFASACLAALVVVLGNGRNLQVLPGLGVVAGVCLAGIVGTALTIKEGR